jgi:hypothetical protein
MVQAPTRWFLFLEVVAKCPDCYLDDGKRIFCEKHLGQKEAIKAENRAYIENNHCKKCEHNPCKSLFSVEGNLNDGKNQV